jgi:hypothetical protein
VPARAELTHYQAVEQMTAAREQMRSRAQAVTAAAEAWIGGDREAAADFERACADVAQAAQALTSVEVSLLGPPSS